MGTQQLMLKTEDHGDVIVPLVQRGGLMTFKHYMPEASDYKKLMIIELTSHK